MRKKEKNCLLTRLHGLKCLVLCALFSLLGIANSHAAQVEKSSYEMVDSVVIDNQTLIGLKQKNIFTGKYFYRYFIKELKSKRWAIWKSKLEYGCGRNAPLWKDYKKYKEEMEKNSSYVKSLFSNNSKGIPFSQFFLVARIIIDEDGSSFCYEITSHIKLTDVFSPKELVVMINNIGKLTFSTPLVIEPDHGYIETAYIYPRQNNKL